MEEESGSICNNRRAFCLLIAAVSGSVGPMISISGKTKSSWANSTNGFLNSLNLPIKATIA
jgi:hypothetical protein